MNYYIIGWMLLGIISFAYFIKHTILEVETFITVEKFIILIIVCLCFMICGPVAFCFIVYDTYEDSIRNYPIIKLKGYKEDGK